MDYNRLVKDLNGNSEEEFFAKLKVHFTVQEASKARSYPAQKGEVGLYIDKKWYLLNTESVLINNPDPVERLDVAILQKYVLDEILGIEDPRTSKRVDFVGGIRDSKKLERRVDSGEMNLHFRCFQPQYMNLSQLPMRDR